MKFGRRFLPSVQYDPRDPSLLVFQVHPVEEKSHDHRWVSSKTPSGGEGFTEVKDIPPSSHTHIRSLWSRESHHSWLTTSSQRTGGAGATILTRGTLLEQAGKIYYFKFIHILNVFVCMLIMIFHMLIIIMLAVSMTKKEGRQQPESYDLYYSYTLNYTTVPPVYYDRTKTTISVFCLNHLK